MYTLRIYYLTICAVLLRKHCWNSENSRASEMTRHEQFRDFTKSLFIQSRTHCVMWLSWRSWGVQSEKGSWNWALAASILRHWTWTALNPWDRTLNVFFASQVSGFYSILFILNRIIPECQGSKWKDKEGTKMQNDADKNAESILLIKVPKSWNCFGYTFCAEGDQLYFLAICGRRWFRCVVSDTSMLRKLDLTPSKGGIFSHHLCRKCMHEQAFLFSMDYMRWIHTNSHSWDYVLSIASFHPANLPSALWLSHTVQALTLMLNSLSDCPGRTVCGVTVTRKAHAYAVTTEMPRLSVAVAAGIVFAMFCCKSDPQRIASHLKRSSEARQFQVEC